MQLQKFGIEIRTVGSMGNLYRDVDKVLKHYNIPEKGVSSEIQASTVAHVLHDMIRNRTYFSYSKVLDCAKVCGIILSRDRENVYSATSSMDWAVMTEDYRQALIAMVLDDFRSILNP